MTTAIEIDRISRCALPYAVDEQKKDRMYLKSFASVLVIIALSAFAAEPSSQGNEADDISQPRFPSPDGRYGLLLTEDPSGDFEKIRIDLVELGTKRVLAELREEDDWPDAARNADLKWSKDSKRVAAYKGERRGGTTRLYIRERDGFAEIQLPELPELPDTPSAAITKKSEGGFPRAITMRDLVFVRWLSSGGVVMDLNNCWGGPSGTFGWEIRMTIDIDAQRKATIKNVVKRERFDKG